MKKAQPRLFTPRQNYKPFEYPEYYQDGWLPHENYHWVHTEIPHGEDVKHFNEELLEFERTMIKKILSQLAAVECEVSDYWTGVVRKYFPKHEIKHMAQSFGAREATHAAAYFYLNEALDVVEESNQYLEDKNLSDKLEVLINANLENSKGELDYNKLALSLAAFSGIAEGVTLFSSFATLLSFSSRSQGLFPGIFQQISYSVRDESLHSNMGCRLFRQMCSEIPDLLTREFKDTIINAARVAMQLEENFINEIFGDNRLPNLTKEELINFMKYRINDRMYALGIEEEVYEVDEQMMRSMEWFEMSISGTMKKDFFHIKPSEYGKSESNWDLSEL